MMIDNPIFGHLFGAFNIIFACPDFFPVNAHVTWGYDSKFKPIVMSLVELNGKYYDKKDANEFVDIVITTGLGLARNVLVVQAGDIVVALPGEYGTLSEIAYCLQFGKPIISLGSWDMPGVIKVKTVDEAVEKVKEILQGRTA